MHHWVLHSAKKFESAYLYCARHISIPHILMRRYDGPSFQQLQPRASRRLRQMRLSRHPTALVAAAQVWHSFGYSAMTLVFSRKEWKKNNHADSSLLLSILPWRRPTPTPRVSSQTRKVSAHVQYLKILRIAFHRLIYSSYDASKLWN